MSDTKDFLFGLWNQDPEVDLFSSLDEYIQVQQTGPVFAEGFDVATVCMIDVFSLRLRHRDYLGPL